MCLSVKSDVVPLCETPYYCAGPVQVSSVIPRYFLLQIFTRSMIHLMDVVGRIVLEWIIGKHRVKVWTE